MSKRMWYARRPWRAYVYLAAITAACAAGGWFAWSNAWNGGARFAAVVAPLGAFCTLLAVGDIMFRLKAPGEVFVVRVEMDPDQAPLEYPCSTYENAFHLALFAQLRGFELTGAWLPVTITPDQPEKAKARR